MSLTSTLGEDGESRIPEPTSESGSDDINIGTRLLYQWGRDKNDWYEAEVVSRKKTAGWWVVQWACDGQKHQLLLNETTRRRWCVIQQPSMLNTRSSQAQGTTQQVFPRNYWFASCVLSLSLTDNHANMRIPAMQNAGASSWCSSLCL
jgi:hypothetical protein